ncbi:uncharacterized protein LOC121008052 [Bufo bufo]|uniref:uncharacterized protein LOC121008052 n=1 Tax=Bufo bufo TaxID=8384 RepID=UPI001ABE6246|nr:uncharacterized protein LOC121008052 [Bufo bufo]
MGNRNSNVSSADEPRDAPSTEVQAPGSANSCTNAPASPPLQPPNPTQATLPDFIVANPTTSSSLMAHLGPPTGVPAAIAHMGERPNSRRRSSSNSPDVSVRRYRRRSAACHQRCSRHRSRSARRSHRSARSRSSRWRSPSSTEVSSCSDTAGRSHSQRRRGAHSSAARASRGASRASAVQDPNPPIAPVESPGPSTTGVPDPSASSFTGRIHRPGPSLGHPAERLMPLIRASVAPRTWTGYGKAWAGWVALAGTHPVHSSVSDRLRITIDFILQAREAGVSAAVIQRRLAGVSFYFRLLGCLAFFGAFRISELLPPTKFRPGGVLQDDVLITDSLVRIRLRRSKTDIFGRGSSVSLYRIPGPACPVSAT